MKSRQPEKRSPGWFFRNNHQFLALSQVPQALNLTASEVTDAVSRGELEFVRISDCKSIALEDLYRYIDERGGREMRDERKAPAGGNPSKGSLKTQYDQSQFTQNQASLLTLAAHLTCRHIRLLKRLLAGPLPRIEADRVTGTTNSPEYISRLRHEFRIEIETERVDVIDRDGFKTRPGVYHLKPASRDRARALLEAHEARRAA